MQVIHAHKETGEISAWGTGDSESSHFADHAILRLSDRSEGIDKMLHKVDWEYGCVADKTLAERIAALRPHVDRVIRSELEASDALMSWPLDRPAPPHLDVVKTYRQALRDLSKNQPDAAAIIRAWPLHPAGADPAASLRERLALIEGK